MDRIYLRNLPTGHDIAEKLELLGKSCLLRLSPLNILTLKLPVTAQLWVYGFSRSEPVIICELQASKFGIKSKMNLTFLFQLIIQHM